MLDYQRAGHKFTNAIFQLSISQTDIGMYMLGSSFSIPVLLMITQAGGHCDQTFKCHCNITDVMINCTNIAPMVPHPSKFLSTTFL